MQIKEEFRRITTISLEQTFMCKPDAYTPKLLTPMKAKGGEVGIKLRMFQYKLSQVCVVLFLLLQEDGPFPLTFSHSHSLTHICKHTAQILILSGFNTHCDYISSYVLSFVPCDDFIVHDYPLLTLMSSVLTLNLFVYRTKALR